MIRMLVAVALLVASLPLTGCTVGSDTDGWGSNLVFPGSARLGDSVVLVVDGGLLQPIGERFGLSEDNLTIELDDQSGNVTTVAPRVVTELPAWAGNGFTRADGNTIGFTLMAVVFDLPASWPGYVSGAPLSLVADPHFLGQPYGFHRTIEIIGDGGAPMVAAPFSALHLFSQQPMFRLAPTWDQNKPVGRRGIDPDWRIAALEFTLTYPTASGGSGISQPQVHAAGEATGALAMLSDVSDIGGQSSVKVSMLAPNGVDTFVSNCPAMTTGKCYPRAPMLTVTFVKQSGSLAVGTPVFDVNSFTVSGLKMFDDQGELLNVDPAALPSDFFTFHVAKNLSEGSGA